MKLMRAATKRRLTAWLRKTARHVALVALCGGALTLAYNSVVESEDSFDRIQAGEWVTASMYWEDKLVSTGHSFNPIGWHAAHKTLPIGTLIRVSNPANHRSITVTINDRGPYVADRDLDLSLGAGALLGFQGLGRVYMEVLSLPPDKKIERPIVENLFSATDTTPAASARPDANSNPAQPVAQPAKAPQSKSPTAPIKASSLP